MSTTVVSIDPGVVLDNEQTAFDDSKRDLSIMDRRIVVSNSALKAVEQFVERLAGVCCNNTTPAGDLVGLCGVLIF